MKENKMVNLTVKMRVTVPQALALKEMFNYWNQLSNIGSSREVALYVDGDGDFCPKCEVTADVELPEMTEEMKELVIVYDDYGNRLYDYDKLVYYLSEKK